MRNLIFRIVTSLILLPIVIMAFVSGGYFLTALLGVVGLLSCVEVAMIIRPNNKLARFFSLIFFVGFFSLGILQSLPFAIAFSFGTLLLTNAVVLFNSRIGAEELEKLSAIFYWCIYVVFAILCLFWMINAPSGFDARTGLSFVFLACLATWCNDTFAYFGGRMFGKHPLFKSVSGKKTWEGFVSGAIFANLAVLAFAYGTRELGLDALKGLELGDLLWVLVPSIVLAPVGDLIESRLKRLYDTKDSSNILPGHGGLLDRIDGLLLVLPWTALYAFIIRPLW